MNHADKIAAHVADDAARLVLLLQDATAVQYLPARKRGGAEDAGVRSKGVHSDPTGDTALDPRRLAVRTAVQRAARSLLHAEADLLAARVNLERALDLWADETRGEGSDTGT